MAKRASPRHVQRLPITQAGVQHAADKMQQAALLRVATVGGEHVSRPTDGVQLEAQHRREMEAQYRLIHVRQTARTDPTIITHSPAVPHRTAPHPPHTQQRGLYLTTALQSTQEPPCDMRHAGCDKQRCDMQQAMRNMQDARCNNVTGATM